MVNQMPQEIEVWYILPAIRRELALALKNDKIEQKKIARLLNVTEPAVSQYLASKRACEVKFGAKMTQMIRAAAMNLLHGSNLISELNKIMIQAKKERLVCKVHRNHDKRYCDCEVCFQ